MCVGMRTDGKKKYASRDFREGKTRRVSLILRASRLVWPLLPALLLLAILPLGARDKGKLSYGEGLIVNLQDGESEVEQVVADVAQNGLIRGTKEYNKDEFISGAIASSSPRVFPAWTEGGKVFYKIREQAIDPRNFKDSNDVGTLVVRYVVQPQGEKNTVLRIDAIFQETFRKVIHQSDGSVESAEYRDIQERLEAIHVMKEQTVEAQQEQAQVRERLARSTNAVSNPAFPSDSSSRENTANVTPEIRREEVRSGEIQSRDVRTTAPAQPGAAPPVGTPAEPAPTLQDASPTTSAVPASADSADSAGQISSAQVPPGQTLEERVKVLRKQVERLVKAPGAPLKSAPFHTASTLTSLPTGTEILILISTPYWYGVETHDGQHGWMMRDELEQP